MPSRLLFLLQEEPTALPMLPFLSLPRIIRVVSTVYSVCLSSLWPLAIMRWLDPSRWTTSPYYALVIFVIACGSIPKGGIGVVCKHLRKA